MFPLLPAAPPKISPMLQPHVSLHIITPAYLSAPFNLADGILARYLLAKSVVLVCGPEVAVDGPHLRPPLAAIWHWALVGEGMYSLMLSVSANVSHASLAVWERNMVSLTAVQSSFQMCGSMKRNCRGWAASACQWGSASSSGHVSGQPDHPPGHICLLLSYLMRWALAFHARGLIGFLRSPRNWRLRRPSWK